jgi:hypothetical protein
MNLSTLFSELSLTGGFSYNVTTGSFNPSTGYMVSLAGFEEQFYFDDFENKDINQYFVKHVRQFCKEESFLGGWVDGNQVYLDVSININDLETAIYTGIINDQAAIFDCANQQTIKLPLPQKSGTMTQNRTYNEMKAREMAYQISLSKLTMN